MAINKEKLLRSLKMGRPPLYDDPEKLAAKVAEYFDEGCMTTRPNRDGVPVEMCIPTLNGLAVYLGFSSREGFYKTADRGPDFLHIVSTARSIIHQQHEENLQTGESVAGAKFYLACQDGWMEQKDRERLKAETEEAKRPLFSVGRKK